MPRNVERHVDTPPDERLGRIAASLVECFESHSERGEGDRVVVCIDSMDERRGLMWSNHGEDRDAFARLIEHTAALCKANGVRLVVAPLNEG